MQDEFIFLTGPGARLRGKGDRGAGGLWRGQVCKLPGTHRLAGTSGDGVTGYEEGAAHLESGCQNMREPGAQLTRPTLPRLYNSSGSAGEG